MNAAGVVLLLLCTGQDAVGGPKRADELEVSALRATVRVVNASRKQEGSGAIVGQAKGMVYVLTAAHVVERADKLEIHTFSATSYPKPDRVYESAEVVARHRGIRDLALVAFPTRVPVPGCLRVCPPDLAPSGETVAVLAAGCTRGRAPTCANDRVTPRRVRRPGGEETVTLWEAEGASAPGRSGGPLVDGRGYLIGVASGTNGDKAYYGHLKDIHRLLDANGFRWLVQGEDR